MSEVTVDSGKPRDAVILVVVLIAFGLILGGFGLHKLRLGREGATWPTVEGTIVGSRLETTRSSDTTKYQPAIRYRYTVDGESHEGHGVSLVTSSTSRAKAETLLARYPMGSTVQVHVDPDNPGRSVIDPSIGGSVCFILIAGVACLLLAVATAVSAVRRFFS